MTTITTYPLLSSVQPLSSHRLSVTFMNGVTKVYDCTPLLEEDAFGPLKDEVFFRGVRRDPHGYGIFWNDDIDLAESELWLHGEEVPRPTPPSPRSTSQTHPH